MPVPDGAYPQQYPPGTIPPEEYRGLMGGLVGGAAGAWGGHKLGAQAGHGGWGTVGGLAAGAFAGSKLEDEWKE